MFEELATNCILHKEYENNNYIGIYVYSDKITFVNHNRPKPPVTIEDLNLNRSFDDRQYLNEELKDMFFSLDLIESYGSGIRRAKEAMGTNHSPKLKFLPDNDVDDYTIAVAYINEEFVKTRDEEKVNGSENENTTKTSKEDLIIKMIQENPQITAEEMAEQLEISINGVRYYIKKLKKEERLIRVGATKKGHWGVKVRKDSF